MDLTMIKYILIETQQHLQKRINSNEKGNVWRMRNKNFKSC